eukprot:TRINITY_DN9316_c0_g7_i1.p1 TRINITY_DN9316_c0_g7~~TRINITY_DN9316_c0_g7_i1.p1  ORF type:complete len:217 (+),score=31.56 TRINITY_DN9316_c0_g7_i1:501-1151(+)
MIGASIFADEPPTPMIGAFASQPEFAIAAVDNTHRDEEVKESEIMEDIEEDKVNPVAYLENMDYSKSETLVHIPIKKAEMTPAEELSTKVFIPIPKQANIKLKAHAHKMNQDMPQENLTADVKVKKPSRIDREKVSKMVNYAEERMKQIKDEKKYTEFCAKFLSRVTRVLSCSSTTRTMPVPKTSSHPSSTSEDCSPRCENSTPISSQHMRRVWFR